MCGVRSKKPELHASKVGRKRFSLSVPPPATDFPRGLRRFQSWCGHAGVFFERPLLRPSASAGWYKSVALKRPLMNPDCAKSINGDAFSTKLKSRRFKRSKKTSGRLIWLFTVPLPDAPIRPTAKPTSPASSHSVTLTPTAPLTRTRAWSTKSLRLPPRETGTQSKSWAAKTGNFG